MCGHVRRHAHGHASGHVPRTVAILVIETVLIEFYLFSYTLKWSSWKTHGNPAKSVFFLMHTLCLLRRYIRKAACACELVCVGACAYKRSAEVSLSVFSVFQVSFESTLWVGGGCKSCKG